MNKVRCLLVFFFFTSISLGQNLYLEIKGNNNIETKVIDSISYIKKHSEGKKIVSEVELLQQKLITKGYFGNKLISSKKINDSLFFYKINLENKTKFIHIYIGKENILQSTNQKPINDTLKIETSEIDNYLNTISTKLESLGYPLAKVSLTNIKKEKNYLTANLHIDYSEKRRIEKIVYSGYEKFPDNHKKNIYRLFKNKIISKENLEKLYSTIQKIRFVKQTKYPEVLFTKDSTSVFVYLDKSKSNSFDGFVGFNNDESKKIIFSGYLDLSLNNVLNSGEKISLNWKSNGREQKNFDLAFEIPYIFKTPIGIKSQLNIFKQDSTFQNTKTSFDIGYFIKHNSKIYFGYQSTESSDIRNLNNSSINDYENAFFTLEYEFSDIEENEFLFPEKTLMSFKTGFGRRNTKALVNNQYFLNLLLSHNLRIDNKNSINLKSQNYLLNSMDYFVNELYRFGGIKSIRGFTENSLQANTLTSVITEYRYKITNTFYIHSIIDYAYFKDNTTTINDNLYSLGAGIGILSKNGLFNLIYANGSSNSQNIKLSNSIIHLSFRANF